MNRPSPDPQADYAGAIEARVLSCLKNGSRSFEAIVQSCDGAYPPVVADTIRQLSGRVLEIAEQVYVDAEATNGRQTPTALAALESNPILCSWYFTEQTCDSIARMRDWSSSRIAFVGTPRLFEWFESRGLGVHRVLFELDTEVLALLAQSFPCGDRLVAHDARGHIPASYVDRFDVVFFDPPWYTEEYLLWLARASELSHNGSVVYPLLPILTRPSAVADRDIVLGASRSVARCVTLLASFVHYEIPSFEQGQLTSSGITGLRSWKRADLVVLDRNGKVLAAPPGSFVAPMPSWEEIDIGAVRFFVREGVASAGGVLLDRLPGQSGLFISPSRRDPGRAHVNVQTSRGHALRTADPAGLSALLRALAGRVRLGENLLAVLDASGCTPGVVDLLKRILVNHEGDRDHGR